MTSKLALVTNKRVGTLEVRVLIIKHGVTQKILATYWVIFFSMCLAHWVLVNNFLSLSYVDITSKLNNSCFKQQVVEDGYEFFAKRQLVTLFSAPNYCGEFDNAGAMMSVDETLMCSFQVNIFLLFSFRILHCGKNYMYFE